MTLADVVRAIKWVMVEKGLQKEWNTLNDICEAVGGADLTAVKVGTLDLASTTPAITPPFVNPGTGRDESSTTPTSPKTGGFDANTTA